MTNRLSLHERREQVHDLLQPDEIRRHRVGEGLEITEEQSRDLSEKARIAALFAKGMSHLSNAALTLDALDPESRLTRTLLGTEPIFQARKRREAEIMDLPEAAITKVDLVMTPTGFTIVEIEPGKIRGLGYGRMVRQQAVSTIGIGSEHGIESIAGGQRTMVALSDHDRFHIPELNVLGRFVSNLCIVSQSEILSDKTPQAILASPLKGSSGKEIERSLREDTVIVSDRRPDLESKGALALAHNTGENMAIEERLHTAFSSEELRLIREASPATHHVRLLSPGQRQELHDSVRSGGKELFAKPTSDAGTRGMLTPEETDSISDLLTKKQAHAFVMQEAAEIVPQRMASIDVLSGGYDVQDMNVRVTLHVDNAGNIIEASVVGSPHEHLAHGGKTSVITNVETS